MESTGPAGNFFYNLSIMAKIWLSSGGSGITPFMSMIREVTDRLLDRKIHLLYGCRSKQEAVFHEELRNGLLIIQTLLMIW